MIGYVLEPHDDGLGLADDPRDVGPEVAGVVFPLLLPGEAEGLARVSRREDIHDSTPRTAIEGREIVPKRSRIQGRVRHPRHESGRSVGFPLDVHHSPQSDSSPCFKSKANSELKSGSPGAEGHPIPGTWSHTYLLSFSCGHRRILTTRTSTSTSLCFLTFTTTL